MKFLSLNRVAIALIAALAMLSCQKEDSSDNDVSNNAVSEEETLVYADESAQAVASFDDVEDIGMIAADEEGSVSVDGGRSFPFTELRLRIGICAKITVTPDDGSYPKTITIDFGDGCICADGKFRKGVIILHLTGPLRRTGSVVTITLRDFYLNRAHVEGTKIITNLSENGNIKFTVQVVGGKVTWPNGRGYSYNCMKYVRQTAGGATRVVRDDVFAIEGRFKIEYNNGTTITLNTESPLVKKVHCPWISDGILKIKINDRTLFLAYGAPDNGACDNKALLTWNNGTDQRLITLP